LVAWIGALTNLVVVFVLAPAFHEAAESMSYIKACDVVDRMIKSGALVVDESKGTKLDGYAEDYHGSPAAAITNIVWKSSQTYRLGLPLGWSVVNLAAFLFFGVVGIRSKHSRGATPTP
jgi:hypothetical protein